MSRFLFIGINYAPEIIGTGKYNSELCEWLASQGHDVCIVTTPPYYPEWKRQEGYSARRYYKERRNDVEVVRCPIWVPAEPRGITRMLHLSSFGLSSGAALAYFRDWKPDWVFNVAPTLATAPGALLYARMTGARSWLHVQDFELDAAMEMGVIKTVGLRRVALTFEREIMRRFNVVSTISANMLERLSEKGVKEHQQELLPNWVDIDGIVPLRQPSPYRSELGIPDEAVVALYSGNMGLKQGLDLLAEAARRLSDLASMYFVFGGEGPARSALEQACIGLHNVRFVGLQPFERLNAWLGLADVHLLPQRADVADLVMPSKLTGMLASGRAVLATAHPGTALAESLTGRGMISPPGDVGAFADKLRWLATNPNERHALGVAARDYAEKRLSRENILRKLESRITQ